MIRLVGKVDYAVFEEIERFGLTSHLDHIKYVPHNEAICLQRQSAVLLLVLNNVPNVLGHIPGKLFEYLASGRPIFGIGNTEGDAAKILRETGKGVFSAFEDKARMKRDLLKLYQSKTSNTIEEEAMNVNVYSRKNLTKSVADILRS